MRDFLLRRIRPGANAWNVPDSFKRVAIFFSFSAVLETHPKPVNVGAKKYTFSQDADHHKFVYKAGSIMPMKDKPCRADHIRCFIS